MAKLASYKPIIFDCTSLKRKEVDDRVSMKLETGIKSEVMATFYWKDLDKTIEQLFFYWLAAHHMNETISPLWLFSGYKSYSETAQPIWTYCLTASNSVDDTDHEEILRLPPELIKDYFNLPSAVVLQKDDLLVLLDEFLSLIAT